MISRKLFFAIALVAWLLMGPRGWAMEVLRGHMPAAVAGLRPMGRLEESKRLTLAIGLPLRNEGALTRLLRELHDPGSPNYRHYLSPAEFTERFGPAEGDYEGVIRFAKSNGLTVTRTHANRVVVEVEGSVSAIEKALHVTMRNYQHPTEARTFYAPDREPSVDLAAPISHISGLDNYWIPRPNLRMEPAAGNARANSGSGPSGTYGGGDFRAAYAPGVMLTGSGQSVGLLEFDGYYASDIAAYENAFGLPAVPLVNVPVNGGIGTPGADNDEVALDIEMVMSMAPGVSQIRVYEAPNNNANWVSLLDSMAEEDIAKQISSSWTGGGVNATAESIFQELGAQGQSFFNASGDTDAYTGTIPFPAESPNITVVGATELTTTGPGGSYESETVWNSGSGVGSSGGISTDYSIPAWQAGISMTANLGSTTMRNVPDVAMVGYNIYIYYNDGSAGTVEGTSCAAPLWAAFTALLNQQSAENGRGTAGFMNPGVYAVCTGSGYGGAFNDITTGNNYGSSNATKFPAVTGYDLCTGWGSPSGMGLINALEGMPPAPVITSALSVTGTPGEGFSYQITATNSPASYGATGLPSGLSVNSATGVISGTATSAATSSVTISASNAGGTASETLTIAMSTQPPVITSALAVTGTNGTAFSYQVAATNNPTGYGARRLPAGLSLNTTTGVISGTPTSNGSTRTNISASNTGGTGSASLTITVVSPSPPVITSALSATGTSDAAFSYQIAGTNSPTSYNATGLPAGLSVDTTTGVISGTPAAATGTSRVTITASNGGGTGSTSLALVIEDSFATWQSLYFTNAEVGNGAISGATADPAGDGIANLMKYALNLNPFVSGVGGLPVESIMTIGGTNYVTLSYTEVILASDISYSPEVSGDLQNWNEGPGYVGVVSVTPNGDGVTETVVVQDLTPAGSGGGRFIRLVVTEE